MQACVDTREPEETASWVEILSFSLQQVPLQRNTKKSERSELQNSTQTFLLKFAFKRSQHIKSV